MDCQSVLDNIQARGLDISSNPTLSEEFRKSVVATAKVFASRLRRLRLVGYLKIHNNNPKNYAEWKFDKSSLNWYSRSTSAAIRVCRDMTEYKSFLNLQYTYAKELHIALKEHLHLQTQTQGAFTPMEYRGLPFDTRAEVVDAIKRIDTDLEHDGFIMSLILKPVKHHQVQAPVRQNDVAFLPGESRQHRGNIVAVSNPEYGLPQGLLSRKDAIPKEIMPTIGNFIPSENYRYEKERDCNAFLTNVSSGLVSTFHSDHEGYIEFENSVRSSLINMRYVVDRLQIIGYYEDDATRRLIHYNCSDHCDFVDRYDFDMEDVTEFIDTYGDVEDTGIKKFKALCEFVVVRREEMRERQSKVRQLLYTLKQIGQTEQAPDLPMIRIRSPLLELKYSYLSETYNSLDVTRRIKFAQQALRKFVPMFQQDEVLLNKLL